MHVCTDIQWKLQITDQNIHCSISWNIGENMMVFGLAFLSYFGFRFLKDECRFGTCSPDFQIFDIFSPPILLRILTLHEDRSRRFPGDFFFFQRLEKRRISWDFLRIRENEIMKIMKISLVERNLHMPIQISVVVDYQLFCFILKSIRWLMCFYYFVCSGKFPLNSGCICYRERDRYS